MIQRIAKVLGGVLSSGVAFLWLLSFRARWREK